MLVWFLDHPFSSSAVVPLPPLVHIFRYSTKSHESAILPSFPTICAVVSRTFWLRMEASYHFSGFSMSAMSLDLPFGAQTSLSLTVLQQFTRLVQLIITFALILHVLSPWHLPGIYERKTELPIVSYLIDYDVVHVNICLNVQNPSMI
jgi:hypothetical protein